MNDHFKDIPQRILYQAQCALSQANMHAAFFDPGNEHWHLMSVVNTAHAGELFLKAIIATEHPLLVFKDIFNLDDGKSEELDIPSLLKRGRTHDFEKLPQVFWAVMGERIPNMECYDKLRLARNNIQHFCAPDNEIHYGELSLEFIYTIIDPLIKKYFDMYAIEFHEDHSVGYDYLVGTLLRRGIKFSIPNDFNLTEINLAEELAKANENYKAWIKMELAKISKLDLLIDL